MTGVEIEESSEARARPIGRGAYLAVVMPLLAVQYAIVIGLRWMAYGGYHVAAGRFEPSFEQIALPVGVVVLASTIVIGSLSARRAATIGASPERAAAAIVPWIQLVAVPLLAFGPAADRPETDRPLIAVRAAL